MTTAEPRDFWSRRRAAVRAEEAAEATAQRAADDARATAELERTAAEKSDAELLAELGLHDPDTMQMGDDFSVFLQRAVPARLRQRALRRLWRTNPVLANLDGLVDHGGAFTDAAVTVPDMRSAYEVGRGMVRHLAALAEAAETEAAPEADAAEPNVLSTAEPTAPVLEPDLAALEVDTDITPDEPTVTTRRHMRFTFSENGS